MVPWLIRRDKMSPKYGIDLIEPIIQFIGETTENSITFWDARFWEIIIGCGTVGSAIFAAVAARAAGSSAKAARDSVDEAIRGRIDEFIPVLAPLHDDNESAFYEESKMAFKAVNVGKGVAKKVRLIWRKKTIAGSPIISAGQDNDMNVPQEQFKKYGLSKIMWDGRKEISWILVYEDIYDREFRTSIRVSKNPDDKAFRVSNNRWRFDDSRANNRA